jgi:ribosome modulation factor
MRFTAFMAALFLFACGFSLSVLAKAEPPASPQYGVQNQGPMPDQAGWDVPPPNFSQIQADGFRAGIAAGQDDVAHQIQPRATAHPGYRNPPQMSFMQRVMYRDGFQKGYQRAMDRFYGAPQPPPPPQQPVYVAPPQPQPMLNRADGMQFRRRGFQDGVAGAIKDFGNNRRPDPNNRDEYRMPNVPSEVVGFYRDGFLHGYGSAQRILAEGARSRRGGPFGDAQAQGYRDGIEGAVHDWDNNRRPDPNNRDEYRRPRVSPQMAEPYRDGFRHGYERVAQEMNGYFGRR